MFHTISIVFALFLVLTSGAPAPDESPNESTFKPLWICKNVIDQNPSGFVAQFYSYPDESEVALEDNFFESAYKQYGHLKTVTGVEETRIDTFDQWKKGPQGNIYGYFFDTTHFSLALDGFFKPPISGDYTFELQADDIAMLTLGSSHERCSGTPSNEGALVSFKADYGDDRAIRTQSRTVSSLEPDKFYPLSVKYCNRLEVAILAVRVKDPQGRYLNIGDHIHQSWDY